MLELRLALKNLSRHKRRTLLTAAVIGFGVMLFGASNCLYAGFEEESIRSFVKHETAYLAITAPGYWKDRTELPLQPAVPDAAQIAGRIRSLSGVKGAVPRVVFKASLNNGTDELPVQAIGTDPRHDGAVLSIADDVENGRYLQAGRDEALLGRGLADLMDLKVGDTFTLVLRNKGTTFEAVDLEVAGILNAPDPTVNDNYVYLPLDVAQRITGLDGAATEILISGKAGYRQVAALESEVKAALGGAAGRLDFHTWEDYAADLMAMTQSKKSAMGMVVGLILLIAGLGVTNNVLLAGFERVREVGTLRALGMTEKQVRRIFMLEGLGIGLFGGFFGALAGTLFVAYLTLVGLNATSLSQSNLGLPVTGYIRGVWNLPSILGAWAAAAAVSYLVSYFPAKRASRLDPATALHQ